MAVMPNGRPINTTVSNLAKWVREPDFADRFDEREQYVVWLDDLSPADLVLLGAGILDVLDSELAASTFRPARS